MRQVLALALALGSALTLAPAAHADGCTPGELVRQDDGSFVVCGRPERPGSTFILPRTRPEHLDRELRRSFTDEIVRESGAL
jgi:hypothetical protein